MAKCEKRIHEDGRFDVDEAIVLRLGFLESQSLLLTLSRVLDLKGLFPEERDDPYVASILEAVNSAEVIKVDDLIPG